MPGEVPQPPEFHYAPGQHIVVNNRRLWVEQEGEGEPILLLPGGPANSHLTFHPHFSTLSDQFRVVYVDYYGRGLSERCEDYAEITFAREIQDFVALIDTLGLGPVNVYGFSYGGMVAQALALDHATRVKRVILANTLHSAEMWQRNHENINAELERQCPEAWDRILALRAQRHRARAPEMQELFRVHGPLVRFDNPDNAAKRLSDQWSRNNELYYAFAGDDVDFCIGSEVAKLPDFRPRLKDVPVPLLVIAGRYDRALYPRYQLEFARSAPQARFVMFEKSGCFAHIEEPDALMTLLREFCRG